MLVKGSKNQKLESLLEHIHHAQIVNFDYKFSITTADSMIQSNGKCVVNVKMDLLGEDNNRQSVYIELSLPQFYQFFHELKRAYSLMNSL